MRGVVHRRVVEENEVLVRASTADVKSAVALTGAGDARQELQHFQYVHFTQQRRQRFDLLYLNGCPPHVGAGGVVRPFADHRGLFKSDDSRFEPDVVHGLPGGELNLLGLEADEAHSNGVGIIGKGQAVETVEVGGSASAVVDRDDAGSENLFPARRVRHRAADGPLCVCHKQGEKDARSEQDTFSKGAAHDAYKSIGHCGPPAQITTGFSICWTLPCAGNESATTIHDSAGAVVRLIGCLCQMQFNRL